MLFAPCYFYLRVYQLDLEIFFKLFFWPALYSTCGTPAYFETCFQYKQVFIMIMIIMIIVICIVLLIIYIWTIVPLP